VVYQDLELYVWLGTAGVALISANLLLWRARRSLTRRSHDLDVPRASLVLADSETELTSSVNAA